MPSETSPARGLDLLRRARDPFRSALARTIEEVRAFLDRRETRPEDGVRGTRAALGAFASGRVDPERFARLTAQRAPMPATDTARIERAFETLRALGERLDPLLALRVPAEGSLGDAVAGRLAEIGRAFGAAHVVAHVRAGSYDEARHGTYAQAYPFARWSAAERALAPALEVEVAGADLDAPALAALLDGSVKILLRVSGPCAPAPLARLLAPRTWVEQAGEGDDLVAFAAWEGAGIAALVPAGAARFRLAPGPAGEPGGLEVFSVPDGRPRPVGGWSRAQQEEELALLTSWRGEGELPAAAEAGADRAGQLATWLLRQARLDSGT